MTISIYIKTHNITGLKYFGKTTQKNVEKYKGSGKYWKRHIKKHGYNCRTKVIRKFDDIEDCRWFCIKFSIINNIVESKDWANLIRENGLDGWLAGVKRGERSEEVKRKISKSKMGHKPSNESKRKMSEAMMGMKNTLGYKHTEETRRNMSLAKIGKKRGKYKKKLK